MSMTDSEENRILDLSLVNGDLLALTTTLPSDSSPGTEATGGSYARQAITWAAAAAGSKSNSAAISFASMPGADLMAWEVYSSASARKWYGLWSPLEASVTASSDTFTATAHGLVNDDAVVFEEAPAGLSAGTKYFVVSASANAFSLSATSGGAALDLTEDLDRVTLGRVLVVTPAATVNIDIGGIAVSLD